MSMSKVRVYMKMLVYIKVYLMYGMLTCKNIYVTHGTLTQLTAYTCVPVTDSKVEQEEGERKI